MYYFKFLIKTQKDISQQHWWQVFFQHFLTTSKLYIMSDVGPFFLRLIVGLPSF